MNMTEAGLDLIRQAEGFRSQAYRDSGGVLTIGYGHTSMAGAPAVTAGMRVTIDEAESILRRDVAQFALVVRKALRVQLSERQFSALVSFCYNVGGASFARSSVLLSVNSGDYAAVPRRLALWNKAAGKVLPGLIKRRAAEAAMFMSADPGKARADEPVVGKPIHRSKSIVLAIVTALMTGIKAILGDAAPIFGTMLLLAILTALAWIIFERIKKSRLDGI
jgi:lysozyme